MKKVLKIAAIIILALAAILYFYIIYPLWGYPFNSERHSQLPVTPSWALECWLWEDDVNTAAYVDELLEGYTEHDIPVRTIIIDSPWSTRYNDFIIDTSRYPNPEKWFLNLQKRGYRVVLWMTPMINSFSKDTKVRNSEKWSSQAIKSGFVAADDDEIDWWKGKGGFIDYTNPEAVKWWHGLQNTVFNYGIDGWKLDGAATLFRSELFGIPFLYKTTSEGIITTRKYMDLYYRKEYQYGLSLNPDFVTLSRAIDRKLIHPEGFSPFDASPVNWVGDQRHSWKSEGNPDSNNQNTDLVMDGIEGIEMAIEHILESAAIGYNIVGSDVAGFSGKIIPPRLYIRWAQLSAFCGLFMNGGHGERRLWKRNKMELDIIRKFSWLHTELIPYMYHYVITAHHDGRRLITPITDGKYEYLFGDNFLIAPVFEDSYTREVSFPAGEWRYFFNDKNIISGDQTVKREFPIEEYPVYIKEGSIIPMNISRSYTKIGDKNSEGYLTVLIYPKGKNNFKYYHPDKSLLTEIYYNKAAKDLEIGFVGDKTKHILVIHSDIKPESIFLDDESISEEINWTYNSYKHKIRIFTEEYNEGNYLINF